MKNTSMEPKKRYLATNVLESGEFRMTS